MFFIHQSMVSLLINAIQDGSFRDGLWIRWAKRPQSQNLSSLFHNKKSYHSYTLAKLDPKKNRLGSKK